MNSVAASLKFQAEAAYSISHFQFPICHFYLTTSNLPHFAYITNAPFWSVTTSISSRSTPVAASM